MVNKIVRGVFFALILAIIVYPAYYLYVHPELLATPAPIASSGPVVDAVAASETDVAILATATPIASIEPVRCLVVHALPGGGGALNLRTGPGTTYAVIATLQDGQELIDTGNSGEWFAVRVVMDGTALSGFVHSSYVEACE